jgi:hypothetical protein
MEVQQDGSGTDVSCTIAQVPCGCSIIYGIKQQTMNLVLRINVERTRECMEKITIIGLQSMWLLSNRI